MRILAINAYGEIQGGADAVYVYGNRLLHQRGHVLAWMNIGTASMAESLGNLVFSLPDIPQNKLKRNLHITKGLFYSADAVQLAKKAVTQFKPDVVHIHNISSVFSPAILRVFRHHNIPVVQTLHDYLRLCPINSFLSHGQVCESCKDRKFYMCAVKNCAKSGAVASALLSLSSYVAQYGYHYDDLVDLYITPSEFLRQKMIDFGYNPEKFITVNNAYFSQISSEVSLVPREKILFVGRLTYEKGVDLLLRACAGIRNPVLIAGSGPAEDELKIMAYKIAAHQNINFLGFQHPDNMQRLYAQSQLLVFPSRWYENGPLVILESYANATPVIGAAIGAVPEFIDQGETGLLFEPDNADSLRRILQQALSDPENLRRMGKNARLRVEDRYSPEQYVIKLERILKSVI